MVQGKAAPGVPGAEIGQSCGALPVRRFPLQILLRGRASG